jgi:hypothetical protein
MLQLLLLLLHLLLLAQPPCCSPSRLLQLLSTRSLACHSGCHLLPSSSQRCFLRRRTSSRTRLGAACHLYEGSPRCLLTLRRPPLRPPLLQRQRFEPPQRSGSQPSPSRSSGSCSSCVASRAGQASRRSWRGRQLTPQRSQRGSRRRQLPVGPPPAPTCFSGPTAAAAWSQRAAVAVVAGAGAAIAT